MITPAQCRMARAALEIGVRDLAAKAGVSAMTVTRFENGHSHGYPDTLQKLRTALEAGGVQFLDNGTTATGSGVALKYVPDELQRAENLNAANDSGEAGTERDSGTGSA